MRGFWKYELHFMKVTAHFNPITTANEQSLFPS